MEAAEADRPKTFGELLRRHRIDAGFSQEELAERARLSVNAVSALERGIRRNPQSETLVLLVEALQLDGDSRRAFVEAARARGLRAVTSLPVPAASQSEASHNLPQAATAFYGREAPIRELGELLSAYRLVTLVGSGGVGKTRTALQVAAKRAGGYRDGVWFVELAPLADGELIASTVGMSLGLEVGSGEGAIDRLARQLAARSALIVLDNCEHLIAAAALVASKVVAACPHVTVFATSRQALGIAGERLYRLPSLAAPALVAVLPATAAEAREFEAVRLFADRARAADHRFELSDGNASVVADICRRLDGIPLAIELAAARVGLLPLVRLRDRLDERFRLLNAGSRDAMPRHRTLRALIDWSYDSLEAGEQLLFRHLSVFAGAFPVEAAVAVGADAGLGESEVFDALASLVDKSLVLADPQSEVPYRLLESTRAYGLEQLVALGEREGACAAHLQHFVRTFESLDEASKNTGRLAEIARIFGRDLEDIRAALDWSVANAVENGARLLAATSPWSLYGLSIEEGSRLSAHLAFVDVIPWRLRASLQRRLANFLLNSNYLIQATAVSEQSVASARFADSDTLAETLSMLALAYESKSRFYEAQAAIEEARALPDVFLRARIKIDMMKALLSSEFDDLDTARRRLEDEIAKEESRGDLVNATCHYRLGKVLEESGHLAEAIDLMERLVRRLHGSRNRQLVYVLDYLSNYQSRLGFQDRALATARESLRLSALMSELTSQDSAPFEVVALALALRGEVDRAALLSAFARQLYVSTGSETSRSPAEMIILQQLDEVFAASLPERRLAELQHTGAALAPEAALRLAFEPDADSSVSGNRSTDAALTALPSASAM